MLERYRYKYDVALSFAGEQRRYVKKIYHALNKAGLKVFYDESPEVQATHLGKRFTELAQRIYGEAADFVVLFVSKEYVSKQWPYLEAAYVLDRMRAELFQGNRVLIGKFEPVELPGFPRDLLCTDLTSTSASDFARTIAAAIACRKSIDQDAVLAAYAREEFLSIITSLTASIEAGVRYEDEVFALYCRACARSRLSQQDPSANRDLPLALLDIAACIKLVQRERPTYAAKLREFANLDDDLLALRTAIQDRMEQVLGVERINLHPSKTAHLDLGGGCVDPNTLIATALGSVAIRDLTLNSEVFCFDRFGRSRIRSTTITHLRTIQGQPRFELNGSVTVSSTQQLLERSKGWVYAQDLRVGMELMREDGSGQTIETMRYRGQGTVMVLGVSDEAHTFIANGFVCHNITK